MKVTNTILTVSALVTIALTTTSCHQEGHSHIDGDSFSSVLSNAILDLECTEGGCTDREDGSIFDKMIHAILDLERPVEPGCDIHDHDHVAPVKVHKNHKKKDKLVRPVVENPAPIVEPGIIDVVLNNSEEVIVGIIDSVFRNREGLREREDLAQTPSSSRSNY